MELLYKSDFEMAARRIEAWWDGDMVDRPVVSLVVPRMKPLLGFQEPTTPDDPEVARWDVEYLCRRAEYQFDRTAYLGEAIPAVSFGLGPGALSVLTRPASKPVFAPDTVWYGRVYDDIAAADPPEFDPHNFYWRKLLELGHEAQGILKGKALGAFPDFIENLDILASWVGSQELLLYLLDAPEHVHRFQERILELYFEYYDRLYEVIKVEGGGSYFHAFGVWHYGKAAKLQCDMSCMISSRMFEEFVVPYLAEQCRRLGRTVYHLDGPGAVQHVDLLLGIQELSAMQWTPGAGAPACGDPVWYPLYERFIRGGKPVMIGGASAGQMKDLCNRFGPEHFYFYGAGVRTEEDAQALLEDACTWRKE